MLVGLNKGIRHGINFVRDDRKDPQMQWVACFLLLFVKYLLILNPAGIRARCKSVHRKGWRADTDREENRKRWSG